MMYHDAALAWLHFVFAFVLVGALFTEAGLMRQPVNAQVARQLLRVDLSYAAMAVLLIVVGVSRVIWGAKGWAYYQAEPFFWAKMAAFLAIGLLSIKPTTTFMRWVKAANADAAFIAPEADVARVRGFVLWEVRLVVLLLLFASLMARGIGMGS